tara:strand:- start:26094 stop:26366 length:273 start_codon:yes stop_codon:yes gene_type:complete
MNSKKIKQNIIQAGQKAVDELIKVAEEEIIVDDASEDLAADRLKNAAATKKLAIFDAFEILTRIEQEKNILEDSKSNKIKFGGFAESRAK